MKYYKKRKKLKTAYFKMFSHDKISCFIIYYKYKRPNYYHKRETEKTDSYLCVTDPFTL